MFSGSFSVISGVRPSPVSERENLCRFGEFVEDLEPRCADGLGAGVESQEDGRSGTGLANCFN